MNLQQKNNSQPNKIINLAPFSIELLSNHQSDTIYANGNMQVGVLITIKAIDEAGNTVTLTDQQLNSIELINYVTGETLNKAWSYSPIENNYVHIFPHSSPENEKNVSLSHIKMKEDKSDNNPTYQKKIYWVTTKKYEAIMIAAQVVLDEETFSTNQGANSSYACVTGYPPIAYHTEDIGNTGPKKESEGKYVIHITKRYTIGPDEHYDKDYNWIQNNYYITLINKPALFSIQEVDIHDTYDDTNVNSVIYRAIAHRTKSDDLYFWFLWGTMKKQHTVGDEDPTTRKKSFPNIEVTYTTTPRANILTAARTDSICISIMYFESPTDNFWTVADDALVNFRFTDNYGNQSYEFKIVIEDGDSFHLIDSQP